MSIAFTAKKASEATLWKVRDQQLVFALVAEVDKAWFWIAPAARMIEIIDEELRARGVLPRGNGGTRE
jgi:hypothetical protein